MNDFEQTIIQSIGHGLYSKTIDTLQVNIGFRCNQECKHCHVLGSPSQHEMMSGTTMQAVLDAADKIPKSLIDITGGAPELHPFLKQFISALVTQHHQVQLRTNLTVLMDPPYDELPVFFRDHKIRLVASLPCYEQEKVDVIRGSGVFTKSIQALKMLNQLGYGLEPSLELILVFNPANPTLPPEQKQLEDEYRRILLDEYGIQFTSLFTITNMPIGRFMKYLKDQHQEKNYMDLLKKSFNQHTIDGLMCRHQINIGWDGALYDCDFNLALKHSVDSNVPTHIQHFDPYRLSRRNIVTGNHCFGCTAGHGSSCGGALV